MSFSLILQGIALSNSVLPLGSMGKFRSEWMVMPFYIEWSLSSSCCYSTIVLQKISQYIYEVALTCSNEAIYLQNKNY